jgi:hypothetical protein
LLIYASRHHAIISAAHLIWSHQAMKERVNATLLADQQSLASNESLISRTAVQLLPVIAHEDDHKR